MRTGEKNKKKKQSWLQFWPQGLFVTGLFVTLFLNTIGLYNEAQRIKNLKKHVKHQMIGQKFRGLEEVLKNEKFIGYYTDRPETDDEHEKLIAQVQYVLAPTIVDINNFKHDYILFVCSNDYLALQKMREIGAEPMLFKEPGMILGKKIQWQYFLPICHFLFRF